VPTLQPGPRAKDPAGFYKTSAEESGAGTFQEINGHPAWVVEADSQAPGFPEESFVLLSIDDVESTLQGQLPLEDIVKVAGTVK